MLTLKKCGLFGKLPGRVGRASHCIATTANRPGSDSSRHTTKGLNRSGIRRPADVRSFGYMPLKRFVEMMASTIPIR